MSIQELQQLLAEQQRMAAEELSEEEGEDQQSVQQISSSEIKEILKKMDRATNICREDPPRQRKSQSLHSLG